MIYLAERFRGSDVPVIAVAPCWTAPRDQIEERIRNVPEANRERAVINAAKTEAMNQTVRPVGNSVRP